MPYGITPCYLLPDRGDIPAFTPAKAGTQFSDPGGMQGWVDPGRIIGHFWQIDADKCIFELAPVTQLGICAAYLT